MGFSFYSVSGENHISIKFCRKAAHTACAELINNVENRIEISSSPEVSG